MGVGEPIIVPDVLRTIALHAPEVAGSLGLVVDVRRDYGASGSALQTTGTIAGGSDVLTIAEVGDFQDGQGIAVAGAGAGGALLVTTIASGGGSTTLVLSTTAAVGVDGAVVSHDDTGAIQGAATAAIALGPGAVCVVPYGTYRVSRAVALNSGLHLRVHGTLFLADGANDSVLVVPQNASGVHVDLYGVLDGNKAQNTAPVFGVSGNGNGGIATPFLNNQGGQNVSGLSVVGYGKGVIQNCYNWGFNGSGVTDGIVEGVVFASNGSANQWAFGATRCRFVKCRAYGTSDDGFAFYSGVSLSECVDCYSYDNNPGSGIAVYNDANGPQACYNIAIRGGACYGNSGIGVSVSSGLPAAVENYNVQVSGVQTSGNDTGNGGGQGGIIFGTGARACVAVGNLSYSNGNGSNGSYGIGFTGEAQYCKAVGNLCWNNGQGSSVGYGLWADSTAQNCTMQDNMVWDDQTTMTQVYGIGGLGGSGMVVRDNWLGASLGSPGIGNLNALAVGTIIEGNAGPNGYNPYGPLAPHGTQPAVPAASTGVQNAFGFPCEVYVIGGTAVSVTITSGGQTSGGLGGGGVYRLQPGDTINLGAYTAAPTWEWVGR